MAALPTCAGCGDKVTPAQRQTDDGLMHAYCAEQQAVAHDGEGNITALHGGAAPRETT